MDYDAIIVGTGFGATVAVSKLVEKGKKVLMLERGTWWVTPEKLGKPLDPPPPDLPKWAKENGHPVQYWPRPDHLEGLLDLFACVRHSDNRDGLYVYSMFDECHIVTASGIGGGSLIYSNATMQPEAAVLQHIGLNLTDDDYRAARDWTQAKRGLLNKVVTKVPLPTSKKVEDLGDEDYLYLDRSRALRDAAAAVRKKRGLGEDEASWAALELAINEYHEDGPGNAELKGRHTFCERQGRCILGCLPQARHTLNKTLFKNYIFDPAKGVTLWPLADVRQVAKLDRGYEVTFRDYRADGQEKTVTAPMLFLAAGTLGTNEILLRSSQNGLALSDQVGQRFSTNGNFAGFCVGTAHPVNPTRGPINTCHVDFRLDGRQLIIEDAAIPSMLASIAGTAVRLLDNWGKRQLFKGLMQAAWVTKTLPDLRSFLPLVPDTYRPDDARTEMELVSDIFFFNCMGQDEANGRFSLDDDELDLKWETPVGEQPVFAQIEGLLKDFSEAMASQEPDRKGGYVPMPLWQGLADHKLTITHPLGGCRIGPNSSEGVVDEHGRVYDGSKPAGGTDVHPGLFITDASVLPGAVVAHPTMTIIAQTLKSMNQALA